MSDRPLMVTILGCADGKFVLPPARRGHRVVAFDIDGVALFGGQKRGPQGAVHMPGLVARLEQEALRKQVTVVHGDFVEIPAQTPSHLVFTSGALQYSRNLRHRMTDMVTALQAHVASGGFLYVDYMLPLKPDHRERENYPGRAQWEAFFYEPEWQLLSHRVLPAQFEAGHVDLPVGHLHRWGHLMARRVM